MARAADIVKEAVSDLTTKLKEIKSSDDDDLGSISSAFDQIAQRADETANTLSAADRALQGQSEQENEDDGGEQPEEQQQ